jgi:hypothetical protein
MAARRHLVFVLTGVVASMGAQYPTPNFLVEAPTLQLAQQVGQAAEYYRKEKAVEWLGYEMPTWPNRCPLVVRVTMNPPSGATRFAFDGGQVRSQDMHIEGRADRLLASVLPHEVTHTVFAYFFRSPVPRWADEGGAVLSEDDVEKERHDRLVRGILNTPGRMIPLRRLFSLRDYPGDVMVLYAEGFSVSNYLVSVSDRPTFLKFIAHGMSPYGWDSAVKTYYRYDRVEELEKAWQAHMKATKRSPAILAQNPTPGAPAADPAHRPLVRTTVPPGATPTFRGQAPSEADDRARGPAPVRPGYLPEPSSAYGVAAARPTPDAWQPAGTLSLQPLASPPTYAPPQVHLGPPQFGPLPVLPVTRPVPSPVSPVGFPN